MTIKGPELGERAPEPFCVLINALGQYSLWPAFRGPPAGWTLTGPHGGRQACLEWIETHWTDIRP
jgi:MbtH protein